MATNPEDPFALVKQYNKGGASTMRPLTADPKEDAEDPFVLQIRQRNERLAQAEKSRMLDVPDDGPKRIQVSRDLGVDPADIDDVKTAEKNAKVNKLTDMANKSKPLKRAVESSTFGVPDWLLSVTPVGKAIALFEELKVAGGVIKELQEKLPGRIYDTGGKGMLRMGTAAGALLEDLVIQGSQGMRMVAAMKGVGGITNVETDSVARAKRRAARQETLTSMEADVKASRAKYSSDNYVTEGLLAGGESVPLTAAAAVASVANPAAGSALIAGMVGGESVMDAQAKGMSDAKSYLYGSLQAAPEYIFERYSMAALMNVPARGFVQGVGKYLAVEIPGEIATTISQTFTDWAMLPENENKPIGEWVNSLPDAMAKTALGVLTGGAVVGGSLAAGSAGLRKVGMIADTRQKAERGRQEQSWLTRIGDASVSAAIRNSAPEAWANMLRNYGLESGVSSVLVDGEAARKYMQSEDYDEASDPMSEYAEQVEAAAAAGGSLALPIEFAAGVLPGTPAWAALKEDMRLSVGGMTGREAQAAQEAEQVLGDSLDEKLVDEVAAGMQQGQDKQGKADKLVAKMTEKLAEAGYTQSEAETQAKFLVQMAETREADLPTRTAESTVDEYNITQIMPAELQRALLADEREMVIAALRGRTTGVSGRAQAGAVELGQMLTRRGWNAKDMSDEELVDVIDKMRPKGSTDGREYFANRGGRPVQWDGAALEGAPKIEGQQFGPIAGIVDAARSYADANGIAFGRQSEYVDVDEALASRIAQAYEEMEHAPNDPAVAEAYADLIRQVKAQYDALVASGVTFVFGDPDSDYFSSGFNSLRDLRDNNSMQVFPTAAAYGPEGSVLDVTDNPMLADTGIRWMDHEGNEQPVYANDLFRAVHDAFGHGMEGAGFRARGEENAWQAHAKLFTGPALGALTSETRGQNSWLNYGPNGAANQTAKIEDTEFAEQKTGLMPEWTWMEGRVSDQIVVDDFALEQSMIAGEVGLDTGNGAMVGWTQNRIDTLLSAYAYRDSDRSGDTKAFAVRLSPDQFLGLTASEQGQQLIQERVDGLPEYGDGQIDYEQMRANPGTMFLVLRKEGGFTSVISPTETTDVPMSGRVFGHEGRHRMTMLKKAGVTSVPVVVIVEDRTQLADLRGSSARLNVGPQRSRDQVGTGNQETVFENMEPISYDNRDNLAQVFGVGQELFQQDENADEPRILNQTAFHGGRVIFPRFSTDYTGRGNGQQFGWGLYFTSKREVAEYWRAQTSGSSLKVGGKNTTTQDFRSMLRKMGVSSATQTAAIDIARLIDEVGATLEEALEVTARKYNDSEAYRAAAFEEASQLLTELGVISAGRRGVVYEVEIPSDDNFLMWDKPLSEQSAKVKAALVKMGVDIEQGDKAYPDTGADLYRRISRDLGRLDGQEGAGASLDSAASLSLLSEGILGITYPDGGIRSYADTPNNYVIFDDTQIEIRQLHQSVLFYSGLMRAVEGMQMKQAPAQQWAGMIKNAPGVKPEELELTGIQEWLAEQKGQISKEELLRIIDARGVQLEETVLEAMDEDAIEEALDELVEREEEELRSDAYEMFEPYYRAVEVTEDDEGNDLEKPYWVVHGYDGETVDDETYEDEDEARDAATELDSDNESEFVSNYVYDRIDRDELRERVIRGNGSGQERPIYQEYSLTNGDFDAVKDTYKEWLLRLPAGERGNPKKTYTGTHFDGYGHKDVLTHARTFDARGGNGEKILMVEELQSDTHQAARQAAKRALIDAQGKLFNAAGMDLHPSARDLGSDDDGKETAFAKRSRIADETAAELQAKVEQGELLYVDILKEYAEAKAWRGYARAASPEAIAEAVEKIEKAKEITQQWRDFYLESRAKLEAVTRPYAEAAYQKKLNEWIDNLNNTEKSLIEAWQAPDIDRPEDAPVRIAAIKESFAEQRDGARRDLQRQFDLGDTGDERFTATLNEIERVLINSAKANETDEVPLEIAVALTKAKNDFRDMNAAQRTWDLRETERDNLVRGEGVPDAPFKSSWPILLMKRLIIHAAENGYDQISWIKEGENNGGMSDNVGWFYENVLPNEVNKFIKKYGGKVKLVAVKGLEPPQNVAADNAFALLGEEIGDYGISKTLGRSGFDQFLDRLATRHRREIEDLQKDIERYESDPVYSDLMISDRRENIKAEQANIDNIEGRRDELWEKYKAARELEIPGMTDIEAKIEDATARRDAALAITGGMEKRSSLSKEELRELYDKARVVTQQQIDDRAVRIESLAKDFEAEPTFAAQNMDLMEDLQKRQAVATDLMDRTADFEASYAAAQQWKDAVYELEKLSAERRKIVDNVPTNFGFDITPQLKEAAAGGFPLFQKGTASTPRARIVFPADTGSEGFHIELFENRNLSSLLHEVGHLRLEQLFEDAEVEGANPRLKAMKATVIEWMRSNGFETDGKRIPEKAHELWADTWETYVREGRAPTIGLKRVFEMIRSWMVGVYKSGRIRNAKLTPEIRDVMERLVATDDQLEAARSEQQLQQLFAEAAAIGMTDGEFSNYQEQVDSARAEASGKVLERAMKAVRDRENKLYKERKRIAEAKVKEELEGEPLFRALAVLRDSRMDKDWLIENMGADVLEQLPVRVPPIYQQGGMDPEMIAEAAGFGSADMMLDALFAAQAEHAAAKANGDDRSMKARMVDGRVDAQLKAEFGDPLSDGEIETEALAAVNNERQGEVQASEIRALARRTGQKPTPYRLARDWAREKVRRGVYVLEASPQAIQRHALAVAKAGREAEEAFLKGDFEAALRAKERQMLSGALLAEAKAANSEVEAAKKRMGKIAKARTMRSVDQDYLETAQSLLEAVEFKERSQIFLDRKGQWEAWASQRRAEGYDVITPEGYEAMLGTDHWTRLTVEQLLGLDEAVKQALHLGRFKQKLLDNRDKRDFAAVVAEAQATGEAIGMKEKGSKLDNDLTIFERIKAGVFSLDSALLKLEAIFDWLDNGNPNGVFNRYVFRPIADAQTRERDMLQDYYARMRAAFEMVDPKTLKSWATKVTFPNMFDPETGKVLVIPRQKIIAMALNWGNAGNRQRVSDGFGFSERAMTSIIMDTLTEGEWAFVQETWDIFDSLWPEISALERRVNGVEPDKIEAIEVVTPFGTLKGGYYPAIYDTKLDRKSAQQIAEGDDLLSAVTTRATTRASSTKARSEKVKRPILLDLGVINRHLGEVIHDITHREPVIQAYKFLSNEDVLDVVDGVLGKEYSEQLLPWVKYVANSWAHDSAGMRGFGKFFTSLRANATAVGMGFRYTTMVTQVAGYSNSFEAVGERWVAPEIARFSAQLAAMAGKTMAFQPEVPPMVQFVREKSGEMRGRQDTLDRDINQQLNTLLMPKWKGGAMTALTAGKVFAFHGIGYMDMVVTVPTWMGAYNKGMAKHGDEELAIYEADKAIRLSQGAGAPKDLAHIQRNTGKWGEALKWLTMYYSYVSALYSRQRTLGRNISDAQMAELPRLLARSWWLLIVPTFAVALLADKGPGEDEDEMWWAFRKLISNNIGAIPVVRDMFEPIWARVTDQPSFGYKLSPVQGGMDTAINVAGDVGNLAEGEETKRMTRNVLELVGYSTGLVPGQLAASAQFFVDVNAGEQDPKTVGDWFQGITKGKIPEEE